MEVHNYLDKTGESSKTRKKRGTGTNGNYNPKLRLDIGRHAAICGTGSTVHTFSEQLGHKIPESTLRYMKITYETKIKNTKADLSCMLHASRGRPTKLGEIDLEVQVYLRKLREAGGIVNRNIAIASAIVIVKAKNPSLLYENGGNIKLETTWAESLLKRMNFVRCKGTKQARNLPDNIEKEREKFAEEVNEAGSPEINGERVCIPPELVLNWDQTGSNLVPISEWTAKEAKQTGGFQGFG